MAASSAWPYGFHVLRHRGVCGMKLIEQIVEVFAENRGTMHVDEVAQAIVTK